MKIAPLLAIFCITLILFSGNAIAETGKYVKPVSIQKDLVISANEPTANCANGICEYIFYLDNSSEKAFSDASIETFFANNATNFTVLEITSKTVLEKITVCKTEKCLETDKNGSCTKKECTKYEEIDQEKIVEEKNEMTKDIVGNDKTTFEKKEYKITTKTTAVPLEKNGKKKFVLQFVPLEKKGSFLLFSKADNNQSYASLDPTWDVETTSLTVNMANMTGNEPTNEYRGLKFHVNLPNVRLAKIIKHANCTADTAYLLAADKSTVLASATFVGTEATFSYIGLTTDTNYYAVAKNTAGTVYEPKYSIFPWWAAGEGYPISGTNINLVGSLYSGIDTYSNALAIISISTATTDTNSDLNIWKVDGYDFNATLPIFTYPSDGNLTITWYAKDTAQRDLNVTVWASIVSGTKTTRLFGDINLSTNAGLCDTNDSNHGMVCHYDWNISGVADANYFLDFTINNGTNTISSSSSKSFNVYTFVLKNYLNIKIVDEQTGNGFNPDSLTIDGNSWTTLDANGMFSIPNLDAIPIAFHSIIATKTGYGTRTWDLNFGKNGGGDYNFSMRTTDINSATLNFQFYDTNGVAQIANKRMVVFIKNSVLNAGQGITDSSGKISFYLDKNSMIYTIQNTTDKIDYNSVRFVVKIPFDEESLATITPFSTTLTNIFSEDQNTSADQNFFAYSNLITPYVATVGDGNSVYYSRDYSVVLKGNSQSYILQPYLLAKAGSTFVTFFSRDTASGISLPNTLITVKRYVNSVLTVLESRVTDSSGAATFLLNYNKQYYIDAVYKDLTINNQELYPITNQYTVRFNASATVGSVFPTTVTGINTTFLPEGTTIDYDSAGLIVFKTIIQSNVANIAKTIFTLSQDGNVFYTITQTNSGIAYKTYDIPIPTLDINTFTITNRKNFDFNVWVQLTDGNIGTEWHTITFVHNAAGTDVFTMLTAMPSQTDQSFMAFVSLFATIIIVGMAILAVGNHPAISFLGGICFIFFGILGWLPIEISIIACIGGAAVYYLRSGF